MGIEGVLEKGFVTTSLDTVINYARTGSLWPMTFGLACCAIEMMAADAARFDLDRMGIAPEGSILTPAEARQVTSLQVNRSRRRHVQGADHIENGGLP